MLAVVVSVIAVLSFWLWLFYERRWTKWLFAATLGFYMLGMTFYVNDYIHYNEMVTDHLYNGIMMIMSRMGVPT